MTVPTDVTETALGSVQYRTIGAGMPVLVLHGSPGGIDQAELMARFLPRDRFTAILLSRPGYLGTELADRRSIDDQADLLAAFLDALDLPRASVISWSGGGPAGYRFAVRHPDRVGGLVAVDAVSRAYPIPVNDLATRLMFTTKVGGWVTRFLAAHAPEQVVRGTLSDEGSLTGGQLAERVAQVLADPDKRQFVLDLALTAFQGGDRKAGYQNDVQQFAAIDTLDLDRVGCPTLVVHGTADSDVTLDDGIFAADTIPGAQLLTLDAGTHLAFWTHPDSAAAQDRAVKFLAGEVLEDG